MKAVSTKCWTCPPALPGKGVTLLHHCPTTLRVSLCHAFAKPRGGRRRAASSYWNEGAGGVHETLRELSAGRGRQRFPLSGVRRQGRRGRVGECLSRRPAPAPAFPAVAAHLRL